MDSSFSISTEIKVHKPGFSLDASIDIPGKGLTVIFGHSGSGKTTLLRCIAGLEKKASGYLKVGDDFWLLNNLSDSQKSSLQLTESNYLQKPAHLREVGYVFQESSLLSHLNVEQNIEFGIRRCKAPEGREGVQNLLEMLGITKLVKKFPHELSGGERQRVAIARALAIKPKVLLMDEPLASLDKNRKSEILNYLDSLKQTITTPIIYVTHNTDELIRLADHLIVMENGKVISQGSLRAILAEHQFQETMTEEPFSILFSEVERIDSKHKIIESRVKENLIKLPIVKQEHLEIGSPLRLHVSAKDVSLTKVEPTETSILNVFACEVESLHRDPSSGTTLVRLRLGESELLSSISSYSAEQLKLSSGCQVFAQVKAVSVMH